ncbi:MAG: hypothetical protein HYY18_18100 [Planctomycetes bacterium]|nr:hypothetical protein [Planctomycetota bacterium]
MPIGHGSGGHGPCDRHFQPRRRLPIRRSPRRRGRSGAWGKERVSMKTATTVLSLGLLLTGCVHRHAYVVNSSPAEVDVEVDVYAECEPVWDGHMWVALTGHEHGDDCGHYFYHGGWHFYEEDWVYDEPGYGPCDETGDFVRWGVTYSRVWDGIAFTMLRGHVHGAHCGHYYHHGCWNRQPGDYVYEQAGYGYFGELASRRRVSWSHVWRDSRWAVLEGHVHGPGCGHYYYRGRWNEGPERVADGSRRGGERGDRPSRPEPPSRPARPEPPDRPARPEHPDRPTRPEHPDRPTRPEHPDRPTRPEHPDRPTRPEHPDRPTRPEHPDRPTRPEHPDRPTRPEHPQPPQRVERPQQPQRVERPQPPQRVERPQQPQRVERPQQPQRVERPQQPQRVERPQQPQRVERPQQPQRVERPQQPQRVERPQQPQRVERPQQPQRVERPQQPQRVERPQQPQRVERPQQPQRAERPQRKEEPKGKDKPGKGR